VSLKSCINILFVGLEKMEDGMLIFSFSPLALQCVMGAAVIILPCLKDVLLGASHNILPSILLLRG